MQKVKRSILLETRHVTAAYGKLEVLSDVSVRFRKGRLTAVAGPNGCGKSSLLKAIMGFLPVSGGEIVLEGEPVARIGRKKLARRIAYLPQDCFCPDYMTLGELIELAGYSRYALVGGPSERDRALYRQVLETVGLSDRAGFPVNKLSGGQRQRAWIAMVLAQDTDIVLLDEPVNHLDMKYQFAVLELIRELTEIYGKTVVAVLHDLNLTTTFADDVVLMRSGKCVTSGPVAETVTTGNVERVFDLKTQIFPRDGRLVCFPERSGQAAVS
ncbi:ABC transporter ATP-binding protein [Labrenzia sp. OB1]|uniref:ABC transporter ATP-binding protein n=1 Tax=Labrenzia sp. OB1 TaxID=1561204 RepID=UPI0007B2C793|nr:ABC transporter ATP-binding protein [Labrenzia sp. OB1]KZM50755.1 ABC transporter [Labrenzia sp. OB1]